MTDSILDQAVFGAYEVLANIIPGTVLLITGVLLLLPTDLIRNLAAIPEGITLTILLFLAFILGVATQALSAFLETFVNRKKYGGYPSSLYLKDQDPTFPEYFKDKIRRVLHADYGMPLGSAPGHVFDLCYTYVMQENLSSRVPQFLRTYVFARNLMVTMIIEAGICLASWPLHQYERWIIFAMLLSLALSYLFYRRFLRYGESFAKEVLKSYFVNRAKAHRR